MGELDVYVWYYGNSEEIYYEVGEKVFIGLGIYDFLGNVVEWIFDVYIELEIVGEEVFDNLWVVLE